MFRQLVLASACAVSLAAQGVAAKPAPWRVGERLEYDLRLKLGGLSLGRVGVGVMEIVGVERVRGRPAYHLVFSVNGGIPGFRVDDSFDSWVDTATFASLRHIQRVREGQYHRTTIYEIFPDRVSFTQNGGAEQASVDQPLDDGSFLYFARELPLAVGERRELARYFKPAQNPVVLEGVRRDSVVVPAGRFDAIVVHPTIRSGGLFADGGRAEMWVSRDERRVMLQLTAHVAFGTLDLSLRSPYPGEMQGTALAQAVSSR